MQEHTSLTQHLTSYAVNHVKVTHGLLVIGKDARRVRQDRPLWLITPIATLAQVQHQYLDRQ